MPFAESRDLSAMVGRFMGARCPIEQSRADAGAAGRPPLWDALATEIGLVGLQVEDQHGGQGAGVAELGAAVLETARAGWSGPLVATAGVAVHLLKAVDPSDDSGLQAAIASGELIVVLAVHEQARGDDLVPESTMVRGVDEATVTGHKMFVDAGMQADVLLVVARALDGHGDPVLVRVDTTAAGVARTAMSAVDVGRAWQTWCWTMSRARSWPEVMVFSQLSRMLGSSVARSHRRTAWAWRRARWRCLASMP